MHCKIYQKTNGMSKHSSVNNFDGTNVEDIIEEQCHFFQYPEDEEKPIFVDCDYAKLSFAIRELLIWICRGNIHSKEYEKSVLRKVIAIAWVLRPEIFNGYSLTKLCKAKGINLQKQSISKQAQNFTERFGIKGRGQK